MKPFLLSTITIAELFTGVRSKSEQATFEQFLLGFEAIPVSDTIARRGDLLRHKYYPSHGTGVAGALTAAAVMEVDETLTTFNSKHFPMMENIIIPYSR